jgi:hypothetical protein
VPKILGTPKKGAVLTTDGGAWTGTPPIALTYRWRRCDTTGSVCSDIAGATASSYTLLAADVGHKMRLRVFATNVAGYVNLQSAATALVAP